MKSKGHPIAGGIVFVLAVLPAFNGPLLSLVFAVIYFLMTCRFGLWGGFWRMLALFTVVLIPFALAGTSQLPSTRNRPYR